MNGNLNDIFNIGVDDISTGSKKGTSQTEFLYKPSADDGKDGTYRALIRFVPNPKNIKQSIITKYVHWLEGPDGKNHLIDSPSSIGESCPIADAFFKLTKSESAVDRKIGDTLKRRQNYYSLIKVIKDPQNPELEGQYRIFKFGWTIKQKIESELEPQFGEPTQVFNLFEGKNFELIITKKQKYNNYDTSKFSGSNSPITIGNTDRVAQKTQEDMALIQEELGNAPSLESYEFKPWDSAKKELVNSILLHTLRGTSASGLVKTPEPTQTQTVSDAVEGVQGDTSDELDSFLEETSSPSTNSTPQSDVSASASVEASSDNSDDIDDFLSGLDI